MNLYPIQDRNSDLGFFFLRRTLISISFSNRVINPFWTVYQTVIIGLVSGNPLLLLPFQLLTSRPHYMKSFAFFKRLTRRLEIFIGYMYIFWWAILNHFRLSIENFALFVSKLKVYYILNITIAPYYCMADINIVLLDNIKLLINKKKYQPKNHIKSHYFNFIWTKILNWFQLLTLNSSCHEDISLFLFFIFFW